MKKRIKLHKGFGKSLWDPYYDLTKYWPHIVLDNFWAMKVCVIEDVHDKADYENT